LSSKLKRKGNGNTDAYQSIHYEHTGWIIDFEIHALIPYSFPSSWSLDTGGPNSASER